MPGNTQKDLEKGKMLLFKQDRFLQTAKTIPDELWQQFDYAIGYDSGTPVSWAVGRLKILHARTEKGEKISVPVINAVLTRETFEQVICEQFSPFIYKCIVE